jgi:hypothetical protein
MGFLDMFITILYVLKPNGNIKYLSTQVLEENEIVFHFAAINGGGGGGEGHLKVVVELSKIAGDRRHQRVGIFQSPSVAASDTHYVCKCLPIFLTGLQNFTTCLHGIYTPMYVLKF